MNETTGSGLTLEQELYIMSQLEEEFNTFSASFYPLLPKRVRTGLLLKNMTEVLDTIAEFLPINSVIDKKMRNKIQATLRPPQDFNDVFSSPGSPNYVVHPYWDSIRKNGKAQYTLVNLNSSVS